MRPDRNLVPCLARALTIALTIVIAGCHAAVAAELAIPPRNPPGASKDFSISDFSMQAGPPNCSRWTDDCVNCMRGAAGASPTCSNIGFACQPKAVRCLTAQ